MRATRFVAALVLAGVSTSAVALVPPQQPASHLRPIDAAQSAGAATQNTGDNGATETGANQAWIVRDPSTGRLYRQQMVTVHVPTTAWETKQVTQTVYEPEIVTNYVATEQTVYAPKTQYVLQHRVRGRWNPFRRTTATYEYEPVTTWVPATQTVSTPVTTRKWNPKQQTLTVQTPVAKIEQQTQLVQTEIPQPVTTMLANRQAPLVRVPLLARQRMLPWPPISQSPRLAQVGISRGQAPANFASNSQLRPIAGPSSAAYSAPLRTASSAASMSRDSIQVGMSATVLR